jgi:hypothetical protein
MIFICNFTRDCIKSHHLPQIHEFSEFFRIKDCSTWIWVLLLNQEEKFSVHNSMKCFPSSVEERWIHQRYEDEDGVVDIQTSLSSTHYGN